MTIPHHLLSFEWVDSHVGNERKAEIRRVGMRGPSQMTGRIRRAGMRSDESDQFSS